MWCLSIAGSVVFYVKFYAMLLDSVYRNYFAVTVQFCVIVIPTARTIFHILSVEVYLIKG